MDLSLLIHPAIAATAVLLVSTAYLLKKGKRLHFRLHYLAGILAFTLSMVAFPVGLYYVATLGFSRFPFTLIFHSADFVLAIGLMLVQGGLGMSMLLFGRKRGIYAIHRRLSKYVVAVFLLQGSLGLLLLYGILPFVLN